MHEAEVTQTSGDFIGRGVHEAARIAALGEADEVVTSARTLACACNGFRVHRPRTATLRGSKNGRKEAVTARTRVRRAGHSLPGSPTRTGERC